VIKQLSCINQKFKMLACLVLDWIFQWKWAIN